MGFNVLNAAFRSHVLLIKLVLKLEIRLAVNFSSSFQNEAISIVIINHQSINKSGL